MLFRSQEAEQRFTQVFRKHETPDEVPTKKVARGSSIIDALVVTGLVASKSEGRRLIEQRGVRVNGALVEGSTAVQSGDLIQVGRRRFVRIKA